jgi:hypothetical protein
MYVYVSSNHCICMHHTHVITCIHIHLTLCITFLLVPSCLLTYPATADLAAHIKNSFYQEDVALNRIKALERKFGPMPLGTYAVNASAHILWLLNICTYIYIYMYIYALLYMYTYIIYIYIYNVLQ